MSCFPVTAWWLQCSGSATPSCEGETEATHDWFALWKLLLCQCYCTPPSTLLQLISVRGCLWLLSHHTKLGKIWNPPSSLFQWYQFCTSPSVLFLLVGSCADASFLQLKKYLQCCSYWAAHSPHSVGFQLLNPVLGGMPSEGIDVQIHHQPHLLLQWPFDKTFFPFHCHQWPSVGHVLMLCYHCNFLLHAFLLASVAFHLCIPSPIISPSFVLLFCGLCRFYLGFSTHGLWFTHAILPLHVFSRFTVSLTVNG